VAIADSMKKSRPFYGTAMALKQISLDGRLLDFLFMFLHGYPPIVITKLQGSGVPAQNL